MVRQTIEGKRDELVTYLEELDGYGGAADIRKSGAHGVMLEAPSVPGDALAVSDDGPNGVSVVDVRHVYTDESAEMFPDDTDKWESAVRVTYGWS